MKFWVQVLVGIWEVNQYMEDIYFSLSSSLFVKISIYLIKKEKEKELGGTGAMAELTSPSCGAIIPFMWVLVRFLAAPLPVQFVAYGLEKQ